MTNYELYLASLIADWDELGGDIIYFLVSCLVSACIDDVS